MNILRTLAACTLVLVTACGADKEPTANTEQPAATTAPASTNVGSASAGSDDVSNWLESESAAATVSSTRERLKNPDAVIERYQHECSAGAKSPACRALRLDVEAIFLESLLAVRATNETVDPRWYRLAAVSETAQLACIGLNELIWDPKRTAQDEALIVRALDSPYRAVRVRCGSTRARSPPSANH